MPKEFKSINESAVLSEETKALLQEEMEERLKQAKEAIQEDVRSEYAKKFAVQKEELIEAMDTFLSDTAKREISEFQKDRKATIQERVRLKQARMALESQKKKQMSQIIETFLKFAGRKMKTEISELREDHKALIKQKKDVAIKLREARALYAEQKAQEMDLLENFINDGMARELAEFHQDRRYIVEKRAEMIKEGRKAIEQSKQNFKKRGAALLENHIENQIRNELGELKTDIREAAENRFARKIFESFVGTFMSSHLSDGTKSKTLMVENQKKDKQLRQMAGLLTEQKTALEHNVRKAKKLEESAVRTKMLGDLLAPLPVGQRKLMAEMLETTKTIKLKEAFNDYLPIIMDQSPSTSNGKQNLSEQHKKVTARKQITGNRRTGTQRIQESLNNRESDAEKQGIYEIRKLAGLVEE